MSDVTDPQPGPYNSVPPAEPSFDANRSYPQINLGQAYPTMGDPGQESGGSGWGPTPPRPPRDRASILDRISGHKRMVIGVVVGLCVAGLVATIGITLVSRDESAGGGDVQAVAGQLTKEYPTTPSISWQLSPGDLGGQGFVSPDPSLNQYRSPGVVHDDRTVVTLLGTASGRGGLVVGVNVSDGSHWQTSKAVNGCSDRIVDHAIACYTDSQVLFIDTESGKVEASVAFPDRSPYSIGFDGQAAYLRYFRSGLIIAKVGPEGMVWQKTFSFGDGLPSGDSSEVMTTDKYFASAGSGRVVIVSTDNGREIVNRPGSVSLVRLHDGGIAFTAGEFTGGSVTQGPLVVVTGDGGIHELPGSVLAGAEVSAEDFAGDVFADGIPQKGDGSGKRWASSPVPLATQIFVAGRTGVALYDEQNSRFVVADATTGSQMWAADIGRSYQGDRVVTDGARLIFATPSGAIVATDLASGSQLWSTRVPTGLAGDSERSTAAIPQIEAVGDQLFVTTEVGIAAYAPTGGAAAAPGAAAKTPQEAGDDKYVTRCGTPPTFTPEQFSTASGGLVIRMRVSATCPKGDVLSGSQTRITVRDNGGLIASGVFDLSASPLVIGGGDGAAATVDLTFPAGSFYRLPDTVSTASGTTGSTSSGGSADSTASGQTILVECDPGPAGTNSAPIPAGSSSGLTASAVAPAVTDQAELDRSVGDALRRQADADKSFIIANLNNRWVAQLSSKRPGLVAEGRTWTNQSILDEFLALRLRFSDARLLYSDEWPVFDYRGWWVTVATPTFPNPEAANDWCRTQGFDGDHCFAKLISTTAHPEGSTRYWR